MALTNATVDARAGAGCGAPWAASEKITLSGLTAGLTANVPHNGTSGVAAHKVDFMVTTEPTDGSEVSLNYVSTDTTNDELDVKFGVPAGGSMDGCILELFAYWREGAAQDATSISTDTDD